MNNRLRKAISATLLCGGASSPAPSERRELNEALNESMPSFQSLLAFTPPSDSARAELDEIEIPDALNSDEDIEMVLDMSDELHLNVTDCVRLIQSAHQEWASIGGAPQDILKHAIRLWFKERREILEDLYTLLRTAVLDQVEPEIQSDLVKFLENIFSNGLRQRNLIEKSQVTWLGLILNSVFLILVEFSSGGKMYCPWKSSYLGIAFAFLHWLLAQLKMI